MRKLNSLAAAMLVFAMVGHAAAEDVTLTTYYPSPRGVYNELRVGTGTPTAPTGELNIVKPEDDGNFVFRADDDAADATPFVIDQDGAVGVGTDAPAMNVDVVGGVKMGMVPDALCSGLTQGTLRWVAADQELQYCDGVLWQIVQRTSFPATCIPGTVTTTAFKACSCGTPGSFVWQGVQDCTCNPDAISFTCTVTCPPPPPPAVCT
jgi:hypothetical protein